MIKFPKLRPVEGYVEVEINEKRHYKSIKNGNITDNPVVADDSETITTLAEIIVEQEVALAVQDARIEMLEAMLLGEGEDTEEGAE